MDKENTITCCAASEEEMGVLGVIFASQFLRPAAYNSQNLTRPVSVSLYGPEQSGKTTLLNFSLASFHEFNLTIPPSKLYHPIEHMGGNMTLRYADMGIHTYPSTASSSSDKSKLRMHMETLCAFEPEKPAGDIVLDLVEHASLPESCRATALVMIGKVGTRHETEATVEYFGEMAKIMTAAVSTMLREQNERIHEERGYQSLAKAPNDLEFDVARKNIIPQMRTMKKLVDAAHPAMSRTSSNRFVLFSLLSQELPERSAFVNFRNSVAGFALP